MSPRYDPPSLERPLARATYLVGRLFARYFDVRLHRADRIPSRGAGVLVGNHALMGIDAWGLLPELVRRTGRIPRTLALRSLFGVPGLAPLLRQAGITPGTRAEAIGALAEGELVLTYPGGARDSLKDISERYRLQWQGRTGFAHIAARVGAPIVPIIGVGPEECFRVIRRARRVPTRGLGSELSAPLFVPIARRVPFDFFVGEPIEPGEFGADPIALAAAARERTQTLLDHHVAWRDAWDRGRR